MSQIPFESRNLIPHLRWRYATKRFDPARKISPADWQSLEDSLVLSPSSFGLQPWKFFVVTDPAVRERLRAAAWNQPQVTECSHLVVLAHKTAFSEEDVERFLDRIVAVRGVTRESLEGYRQMMLNSLFGHPDSARLSGWCARQVYLALGILLSSAAALGIDACPMEGFNPEQYNEILRLPPRGLSAVVQCALGYRSDEDAYAKLPKVRFTAADVIEKI